MPPRQIWHNSNTGTVHWLSRQCKSKPTLVFNIPQNTLNQQRKKNMLHDPNEQKVNWTTLDIRSTDITAVKIKTHNCVVLIFNLYCNCTHNNSLLKSKEYMQQEATQITQNEQNTSMIWLGDFNWHHPQWDEERNSHLFTQQNLGAAQTLVNTTIKRNMHTTPPKNLPALKAMSTSNYTCTDNIFFSANLTNKIIICTTIPEDQPAKSNHIPIDTTLETNTTAVTTKQKYNYRQTIWEEFNKTLKANPPWLLTQPLKKTSTSNSTQ